MSNLVLLKGSCAVDLADVVERVQEILPERLEAELTRYNITKDPVILIFPSNSDDLCDACMQIYYGRNKVIIVQGWGDSDESLMDDGATCYALNDDELDVAVKRVLIMMDAEDRQSEIYRSFKESQSVHTCG